MTSQIAVRLPTTLVENMDVLVARGQFASRTEAVRVALEQLLEELQEEAVDVAIQAEYSRLPAREEDPWVEAATRALVAEEPW